MLNKHPFLGVFLIFLGFKFLSMNQTFAPTAPNQVWVADLTYVATQEGWL
ncbi:hypothetical protein GVK73_25320, partial [Escherichia coli]|nr:hypothetical protein [Escherichia coli]